MDPHPHGNPLTHLCERAGIPQLPYALEGLTAGVALVGEGGVRVRSSLQSSLIRSAAGVEDAAAKFTARTPPSGAPAASAGAAGSGREETLGSLIDAYCATETDAGRREWMRFILHTVVETELAAPAGGLSTAVLEVPEPYGGGDDVPGGGCRRLITALTPDAPIRTGATSRSRRAAYRPRCGKDRLRARGGQSPWSLPAGARCVRVRGVRQRSRPGRRQGSPPCRGAERPSMVGWLMLCCVARTRQAVPRRPEAMIHSRGGPVGPRCGTPDPDRHAVW
nr:hypothetical protein GCM10020093_018300 [Planobispora longispora]